MLLAFLDPPLVSEPFKVPAMISCPITGSSGDEYRDLIREEIGAGKEGGLLNQHECQGL